MGDEFYSLDQVAGMLDLHVRTVRAYVREGRIKAVRIGKQYRVARADLEAFTGHKLSQGATPVRTRRHVEVSSVVQIDAIDPDSAMRISNTLVAISAGPRRRDDSSMEAEDGAQVSCRYHETTGTLKVLMTGSLEATTGLLKMITLLLEQ